MLVNSFYQEVRDDNLIGPIFKNKINKEQWPSHLEKMANFWNTVLFHAKEYRGNPFSHHISLNIEKQHFDRWITLFHNTINKNFKGPKATEAMMRADKMRLMFESKLKYIKSNSNHFPII